MFWIFVIAVIGGGAYLIYKYGMKGAIAAATTWVAGVAAWFAGLFDKVAG